MKQRVLVFLAAFLTVWVISCKPGAKGNNTGPDYSDAANQNSSGVIVTESLFPALSKITTEQQKMEGTIAFMNSVLPHKGKAFYEESAYEYHGVRYSYDVNGKYLFVTETEYGGAGSSYQSTDTYIFDTDGPALVPLKNIFANTSDPSFAKLVTEYLSKDKDFNMIDLDALSDSLSRYGFNVFNAANGVGMRWDGGAVSANAYSYEIVLPYSAVKDYLTPTGQDVFKGK